VTSVTDRTVTWARRRRLAGAAAIATCLTAGGLVAAPAWAGSTAPPRTTLRGGVDALVASGAPGALLLVRDGERTVRLTGGFGDVARRTPMRSGDHFKIASLTKTYTATVVLQLAAEGRLRLSDSVERWLPGLVPNGRHVTIRQLLSHTSGLAEFDTDPRYLEPYLGGNLGFYWAPRKLVEMALSHPPVFPPGRTAVSSYSNTNYVLAGLVAEAVTGHSIATELKRRIFRPLGLRHTSYQTKPGLPAPYAHGYMVLDEPPMIDVTGLSPSLSRAQSLPDATGEAFFELIETAFCSTART
jgi:D-alanyl-D-alanine carboxypeptidase